jgi:hypothetical protein
MNDREREFWEKAFRGFERRGGKLFGRQRPSFSQAIVTMLLCYCLPYIFRFTAYMVDGSIMPFSEAYIRSGFLLIVLIYINTKPWKGG